MPTVANKHSEVRRIFYPRFDGGLNLSASPETIAINELRDALNVEVSQVTGKLKVRGGLVWNNRFSLDSGDNVKEIIPIQGSEDFLMLSEQNKLYHYRNGVIYDTNIKFSPKIGNISAAMWDDSILLAYGVSLLQVTINGDTYDYASSGPKNSRYVFVRNGRVGVVDGDNTIRFSAIGDCDSWEDDPDDDSTGKFIDIGYKDGMKITALCPLSKDLIIFKSSPTAPDNGKIWRLIGDYPDWQVVEAVQDTGTYNYKTVKIVGNDVFYITASGLATLSTVMEYGDVKMNWVDRKVAKALTALITSSAQLWHVTSKSQLWVTPSEKDNLVWIFDYGLRIWTYFEFPKLPKYVLCVKNNVFVFIDNDIYELNDYCYQDEMKDAEAQTIKARIVLGILSAGLQILVKSAYASYEVNTTSKAELVIGKFRMPLKYRGSGDFIYDDYDVAYEDDDTLIEANNIMTARQRCLVKGWTLSPEIKISGGGFELSTLGFETVEV